MSYSPTYNFRCRKCQKEIEVQHHMTEPHPTTCECGGELQRIFHPIIATYHISGFYRTDKVLYPNPNSDEPRDDSGFI